MESSWLNMISPCFRPVQLGEECHSHSNRGDFQPAWVEAPRVIYDHELVLFSKGYFRVEIDGRDYECGEDMFIIIPPGLPHTTWNVGEMTGRRHWAHFDWVHLGAHANVPVATYYPAKPLRELFRPAPSFVPEKLFHGVIQNPARAYELHERVVEMQTEGKEHERLVSRGPLLSLLIELLDSPEAGKVSSDRESFLAHQVRIKLEKAAEQAGGMPSVQLLLEELGCSYAHLCRLFRRRYGVPPLVFLQSLRITRAKLLLREPNARVSDVAYQLGFEDLSYFSQLFRKFAGASPRDYAAGVRGTSNGAL